MHHVNGIQQICAAIDTELISLRILLGVTIPAALVALVVGHAIDVFLRAFADDLGNLVAFMNDGANCQHGKIAAGAGLADRMALCTPSSSFCVVAV